MVDVTVTVAASGGNRRCGACHSITWLSYEVMLLGSLATSVLLVPDWSLFLTEAIVLT